MGVWPTTHIFIPQLQHNTHLVSDNHICVRIQPQQPVSGTPVSFSQGQTAAAGQPVFTSHSASSYQSTAHPYHSTSQLPQDGDTRSAVGESLFWPPENASATQYGWSQTQSADISADGHQENIVPGKHMLFEDCCTDSKSSAASNAVRQLLA